MKKGYLILFSIIFCLMIIIPLPCLKTAGRQGSNPRKIDSENASFRVIFPDGSICEMSAKDYVFGVLAAEMSPSAPEQALKAQACLLYTSYVYKRQGLGCGNAAQSLSGDILCGCLAVVCNKYLLIIWQRGNGVAVFLAGDDNIRKHLFVNHRTDAVVNYDNVVVLADTL